MAAAKAAARDQGLALYLAGGVVRDLLLGRTVRDVDLVVLGDGIHFARSLTARLGGSIREHLRFGTATLTLPSGENVDVASARRETYAHPGALPAIRAGASIEEDLARRDFTVNAMAFELAPVAGRVLDPFGAARDLARGVIRELHAGSFLDDPTRAFRAVRYSNRLGFRISPRTREAIGAALAAGALGHVSGDRLRREIHLILDEPARGRAVAEMGALGLSRAVEPALDAHPRAAAGRVTRAESLTAALDGEVTWLCYLLAWMWQAVEQDVERVAHRLALAGEEARVFRRWPGVSGRLAAAEVRSDVTKDEVVAAASGLDARRRRALVERAAARSIRLAIRGRDLIAAGVKAGPAVGAALAQTLAARQKGRIRESDELAFALAAVEKSR